MSSKTIDQWCESHNFSRAFFYKLKKQRKAPKTFAAGRCQRISDESDAAWTREREAESRTDEAA